MGKDILKEVIREQKLFLIIQITVILAIFLLAIFAGTNSASTPKKEAICGDGVLDKKEDFESCCLDAGCADGFSCLKGDDESFTCEEGTKEEMTAYKEFRRLGKTLIEQAYNYEEASQEISLSRKLMKKSIDDMGERGFSIIVEEESFDIILTHVDLIETIGKLNKESEQLTAKPAFLGVFYLDEGSPLEVRDELQIMKNNTQESINKIVEFQNKLRSVSEESKEQLEFEFNLNTEVSVLEYDVLLESFNETNIKATKLLDSI